MEVQFRKTAADCLRQLCCRSQTQEQTQEIRLEDTMPDIGRVLGAWGQVLVRGKEWRGGSMGINGGVMVWVLYEPEDGGMPCHAEAWIPFQMKWELPETQREGVIQAHCLLNSVDARSTSARKLMVRTCVNVLGRACLSQETVLYEPDELPEDIRLLQNTYPMQLPKEAGEKSFSLEESVVLPGSCPPVQQIIRYTVRPEIGEQRLMTDKLIFRGNVDASLFYLGEDGNFHDYNFQVPYSQYTDLEQEYGQGAEAEIRLETTSLELAQGENGSFELRTGIVAQYTVFDRMLVKLTEDAYSPVRDIKLQMERVELPAVLSVQHQTLAAEESLPLEGTRIADLVYYPDQPKLETEGDQTEIRIPGWFQVLYYDPEGNLQGTGIRTESLWQMPASGKGITHLYAEPAGKAQGSFSGGTLTLHASCSADAALYASHGFPTVTVLEAGEASAPDPDRASFILRKAGDSSLWQMAKQTGSTVEAIQTANHLTCEPDSKQILLIPVL